MDALKINTVEQQREQLIEAIRTLPDDALQEVADEIARLRQKTEDRSSATDKEAEVETSLKEDTYSPYEDLKEFGLIGYVEDGPSDLSVNYKKYLTESLMEKYGYC
ncbi:MAG: hypothetical protein WBA76_01005 [Phormidesmis sp.]